MLTMEKIGDDQHDRDDQNLDHGGPGVVDDDLAQVDGVEDDRSSPGTQ